MPPKKVLSAEEVRQSEVAELEKELGVEAAEVWQGDLLLEVNRRMKIEAQEQKDAASLRYKAQQLEREKAESWAKFRNWLIGIFIFLIVGSGIGYAIYSYNVYLNDKTTSYNQKVIDRTQAWKDNCNKAGGSVVGEEQGAICAFPNGAQIPRNYDPSTVTHRR